MTGTEVCLLRSPLLGVKGRFGSVRDGERRISHFGDGESFYLMGEMGKRLEDDTTI